MFTHFSSILDDAFDTDDNFKIAINTCDSECLSLDSIGSYPGVSTSSGISRMTIIDESYDWVCKWCYCDDALGNACERELKFYNAAKKFGIEDMFVEVHYLGTYSRHYETYNVNFWEFEKAEKDTYSREEYDIEMELYAYKKVQCSPWIHDDYMRLPDKDKSLIKDSHSPLAGRSVDVAAAFLRGYGRDKYLRLNDFCIENRINDLHTGNIGYKDGTIVLIDYAGYFDEGDYYSYEERSSSRDYSR